MQGWEWRQGYGELDASKIDGVVMLLAMRIGLEGAVLDAEGALGQFLLEADSDHLALEAREAAVFGRWKTTELPSALFGFGFRFRARLGLG